MNKAQGAVSQAQNLDFEGKLMDFIQAYANRYVGGMSNSLPMEQMQGLAASAFYQMTFVLEENGIPDPVWAIMHAESLRRLQQEGIYRLKSKIAETKQHFRRIQQERIKIPQRAYQDTLMQGIPLFFAEYDVEYAAHETPGSIDYQLTNPTTDKSGIVFMANYLKQLDLENQFCRHYSPVAIHRLMKAFDPHYEVLLENHFEHVLLQAIGRILLTQPPRTLALNAQDLQAIDSRLRPLSSSQLHYSFMHSAALLFQAFSLEDPSLRRLIESQLNQQLPRIQNALEHHTLDKVWTIVL